MKPRTLVSAVTNLCDSVIDGHVAGRLYTETPNLSDTQLQTLGISRGEIAVYTMRRVEGQ